jgi:integrase
MAGDFIQRSRHGTVFYFRRRVPVDLRPRLGRLHLYASLRTELLAEAKCRARALAAATDRLFTEMRYMQGDDKDKLVQSDYGLTLDFDDLGRPRVKLTDLKPGEEASAEDLAKRFLGVAKRATPAVNTSTSPTVAEAMAAVLADSGIKPNTVKEYRRAFRVFGEFVGPETRLEDIPQERFAEFADHVRTRTEWAAKTQSFHITAAQRLFTFYESRNSAVPKISSKGLKPKRLRPAGLDREAFTLAELKVLFTNAAKYRKDQPHKWWATVAPAFLGCRIEELAQAHLGVDIFLDSSGCWVLKIDESLMVPEDESESSPKSVKSFAGWRKVPLHPALVDAGFIDYIERERKFGAVTPFGRHWRAYIDRETGGVKHSKYLGKWGGRELDKLQAAGLLRLGNFTYNHSLRHSFVTILAKAGVSEEWRAALAGQAYGGINSAVYNKAREDVTASLPIVTAGLADLATVLGSVIVAAPQ